MNGETINQLKQKGLWHYFIQNKYSPLILCWAITISISFFFDPYISPYGDVQLYINTRTFDLSNYQPVWPWVAGAIYQEFGESGLFTLQLALYLAGQFCIYFAIRKVNVVSSLLVLGFSAINIKAYLYIANPLSEGLNFFLFSFGFYIISNVSKKTTFTKILIFGIPLMAIGLTRSANLIFLFVFFVFVFVLVLRKMENPRTFGLVVPALLIAFLFNIGLAGQANNVGINIQRFLIAACHPQLSEKSECNPEIFTKELSPTMRAYVLRTGSVIGVEKEFEEQGQNVWSAEFSDEAKNAYLKLFLLNPDKFASAIITNWTEQFTNVVNLPYPEDINSIALEIPGIKLLNQLSTSVSLILAFAIPFGIIFLSVVAIQKNKFDLQYAYLIAWVLAEIISSQVLFSNLWSSDASRMRFHYEIPALIIGTYLFSILKKPKFV